MRFLKNTKFNICNIIFFTVCCCVLFSSQTIAAKDKDESLNVSRPFDARHGDGDFNSYGGAYYDVGSSSSKMLDRDRFNQGTNNAFHEHEIGIRPPKGLYTGDYKGMKGKKYTKVGGITTFDVRHGATNMLITWRNYFRWFAYIVSGVGMFALALLAFVGKFQWKWFFSLTGSVFVLGCFLFLSGQTGNHGDNKGDYVNNGILATDGWLNPDTNSAFTATSTGESILVNEPIRLWRFALERARYSSHAIERFTYLASGIGVFGMAILAFLGKFEWKWFFMLCGGLFMVSGFQMMIDFLHGTTEGENDQGWYSNLFVIGIEKTRYLSEEGYFFTYVVAGLGVMYLAFKAFFGKFEWKHFLSLCGALFIVGGFQTIINFTAIRGTDKGIKPTSEDATPERRRNLEASSSGGSMMPDTVISNDNIYTVSEPEADDAYTTRGSEVIDDD